MRVLCPSCQQLVTLPDSSAGQTTPCPLCGKTFTPPALTGASIDAAPPPAPAAPLPRSPEPTRTGGPTLPGPTAPASSPASSSGGLERCCTSTLHKDIVRWLAPVALFIAFILSFFTWLAAAPNGTKVYTQHGWQAMYGSFSVDVVGDEVLQKEDALKKVSSTNGWLVLYFILLIWGTILAVGSLVIELMHLTVPDIIKTIWPHRDVLIAGVAALLLITLVAPMISGFGLESAAVAAAEQAVPPLTTRMDGSAPTTKELQVRELKRDVAVASCAVRRTGWLCVTLFMHLLAVAGAGTMVWLDRRGNRPEPRIECYC